MTSAELQRLINEAAERGDDAVHLPPGTTIEMSETILLPAGISIIGGGWR